MGKRRQGARQDVLLLTELGDIVGLEFETEPGYIVSQDTMEAWQQDYNQQVKSNNKGKMYQVISERSKYPIRIFKSRPALKGQITEIIADQTVDRELNSMANKHLKNKMLIWVGIIAALFAVVISIVVLVQLKNGHPTKATLELPTYLLTILPAVMIKPKQKSVLDNIDDVKSYNKKPLEHIQCIVVIEASGELSFLKIANNLIPADSIQRNYRGRPAHFLSLDLEGRLWAIEPQEEIQINETPSDLFFALNIEKPVQKLFIFSDSIVEKVKIGFFFLLCIIELIVLFLIITTATGGKVA